MNISTMNRQIPIIFILMLGLLLSFWFGSRYPDLNAKALMAQSGAGAVHDLFAAWPVIEINPHDPLWQRILYSTINWLDANKKGMTFGVLFGGLVFALLPLLTLKPGGGRLKNTLLGVLMGTPLGVCVNCAAPVFQGVLQTRRLEMATSMMMSSPTLNIVVVTMVFSLFPLHLALLKIGFTFFIILSVPILITWVRGDEKVRDWEALTDQATTTSSLAMPMATSAPEKNTLNTTGLSWAWGTWLGLKAAARGIGTISVRAVPLMFLAGFLGAVIGQVMPLDALQASLGPVSALFAAIAIVLLPIPVAFDVTLANAFFSQGVSFPLVAMMLSGFGIYSLYAFFVLWRSASLRWAMTLLVMCILTVWALGLCGDWYHQWAYLTPETATYERTMGPRVERLPAAIDRQGVATFTPPSTGILAPRQWSSASNALQYDSAHLKVSTQAFNAPSSASLGHFSQIEGQKIGLVKGFRYGIRDYVDPFWVGRGTAAGDINQDGWMDVVFGSNVGPQIYLNRGGWFEQQPLQNEKLAGLMTYAVALVDWNNDGWLDLFVSTSDDGNGVLLNQGGVLDQAHFYPVPNNEGLITVAPGFADLDNNGYLDVVNGNMALGVITGSQELAKFRNNSIVFNNAMTYREHPFSGFSGETMAGLVADINDDGYQDIYFNNDFVVPDRLLMGTGKGFHEVTSSDQRLPVTPVFSMSMDIGDVNNDLIPDLLIMGTLERRGFVGKEEIDGRSPAEYATAYGDVSHCDRIEDPIQQANCVLVRERQVQLKLDGTDNHNLTTGTCEAVTDPVLRQECLTITMWSMVTRNASVFDCSHGRFDYDWLLGRTCDVLSQRGPFYQASQTTGALTQEDGNWLLMGKGDGFFEQADSVLGEGAFRHPGGWTWNARFVDLDNDGWQDVFNADGVVRSANDYGWNVLMHNRAGKGFEQQQFSWNLDNPFNLFSFVTVDYDLDGDLDIIGNSSMGAVQVYRNDLSADRNAVSVVLRDERGGNRYGVGATITLRYRDAQGHEQQQRRWIKASGGYQSFDPLMAWFGVGEGSTVLSIRVHWPDGEEDEIRGDITLRQHYRIERS
ncbi:MAG: FG-GAP-like repeat-containing protein [Gammaproteobacteria bacterium]